MSGLFNPDPGVVNKQLTNAPLPQLVQKLGVAIAQAQRDMDRVGIEMAVEMKETTVTVNGQTKNLLELGLQPTFYTFTEATIEAKVAFSSGEQTGFQVGGSVGINVGLFAASVDASYSRKFSYDASGSSSVSTRLVSLPAPMLLTELLQGVNPSDT